MLTSIKRMSDSQDKHPIQLFQIVEFILAHRDVSEAFRGWNKEALEARVVEAVKDSTIGCCTDPETGELVGVAIGRKKIFTEPVCGVRISDVVFHVEGCITIRPYVMEALLDMFLRVHPNLRLTALRGGKLVEYPISRLMQKLQGKIHNN